MFCSLEQPANVLHPPSHHVPHGLVLVMGVIDHDAARCVVDEVLALTSLENPALTKAPQPWPIIIGSFCNNQSAAVLHAVQHCKMD